MFHSEKLYDLTTVDIGGKEDVWSVAARSRKEALNTFKAFLADSGIMRVARARHRAGLIISKDTARRLAREIRAVS
jgi:hypothetical protein